MLRFGADLPVHGSIPSIRIVRFSIPLLEYTLRKRLPYAPGIPSIKPCLLLLSTSILSYNTPQSAIPPLKMVRESPTLQIACPGIGCGQCEVHIRVNTITYTP